MDRQCNCVLCGECRGTGRVEYSTGGYPEWELETCPECHGSAYSEVCANCEEDYD